MRIYEAMFLVDSAKAAQEKEATEELILGVMTRYGADVKLSGWWDERKLAYQIKKQRRGNYYLAYLTAPGENIQKMRTDFGLTEDVLRCLFLALPVDVEVPETIEVPTPMGAGEDDRMGGMDGGMGGRDGGRRDDGGSSSRGGDSGGRLRRYGKFRCRFTRWKVKYVDWKETQTLSRLCTSQGKMFSRKRSGNTAGHQRQFKKAVKYARFMGLLPYVAH